MKCVVSQDGKRFWSNKKIARVSKKRANLRERKRLNQFFNFSSSPPRHYERNFLVEKQINVCDSSFNSPVYFALLFSVLFFLLLRDSRKVFFLWVFLMIFVENDVTKIERGQKV